ncbi:hypothetical protein D9758_002357 [Tetrapyrgos nigripes]|uniref:peptidyl-tRNA hydrolase n=1 Tax=Tetrapyrgos nigripes TaxID=182062 RepID=A0A8H5GPN7_9AGAR|nr:hypothetical protein D9758_002357 [Tetrapyrgos nigripes]
MNKLQSSQLLLPVLLGTASAALGFYLGRYTSKDAPVSNSIDEEPVLEDDDGDEDAEGIPDGDLSAISAGFMEPCKIVLIVRTDLKMSPGKISAQCGHATLACYKALVKKNPGLVRHWERTGQAKIALKANSEDQLLELEALAKSLNLCARSVEDALSIFFDLLATNRLISHV